LKETATSKSTGLPIEESEKGDESVLKEVVEKDSNSGNSEKMIKVVGLDSKRESNGKRKRKGEG
jgi:hypothetical protein